MTTTFRPDYPIGTERLRLRPYRREDLDDLLPFHSDPEVVRYIPWPVRDREQTRIALEAMVGQDQLTDAGQALNVACELRATGRVIGGVILMWHSAEHRAGEIGFAFHRQFHGQGLVKEATQPVLEFGFETVQLHRIVGRVDGRNEASAGLLTRLGFRQEAHLRENEFFKGEWTDELIFALLRSEWLSRKPA